LLLFDGDCGFCRFWVARWRAMTRGQVDFAPAQQEASRFPQVTEEAWKRSMQLVTPEGAVYGGAEAAFRALAYAPEHRWMLAVYRRLPARSSYIILAPNHFGRGAPLALMSQGEWLTPLGTAPIDHALARSLAHACHLLTEDAQAHSGEHSLEVQIPFLQHLVRQFSFVPVSIGVGGYAALESLGRGVAKVVKQAKNPVLIIASSDMNHYEPDDVTRIKDRKAIDPILALDPKGLYEVIRREDISMCGYGPAVAMLTAAKELGATRADLVKYATSADTSGDRSTVVGYAGIVIS
jgi:AmmeMemoRadiSam system protein B